MQHSFVTATKAPTPLQSSHRCTGIPWDLQHTPGQPVQQPLPALFAQADTGNSSTPPQSPLQPASVCRNTSIAPAVCQETAAPPEACHRTGELAGLDSWETVLAASWPGSSSAKGLPLACFMMGPGRSLASRAFICCATSVSASAGHRVLSVDA